MKNIRAKSGPFSERIYYPEGEIESICSDELAKVGLLPAEPAPIRIDRFIEKRFQVTPSYEDLGGGVLGLTRFGDRGVYEVVISQHLESERTQVAERRVRSTLAHEAGHGLLHAHLFVLAPTGELFQQSGAKEQRKVLCRGDLEGNNSSGYNGEWWEFQANRAIGALLLPKELAERALQPFVIDIGKLGFKVFDRMRTEAAARSLADIFDVNPAVVRVRIDQIFPLKPAGQMTL